MSQIDLKEKFYGHIHIYRDNLVEFRVITPSPEMVLENFFARMVFLNILGFVLLHYKEDSN